MRPLRYSINVTLDGCCDHRAIVPDEEMADLERELARVRVPGAPEPARSHPHFNGASLRFDSSDRLWVRTFRGGRDRTIFDVFSPALTFLGEVIVPEPIRTYDIGGDILAAVVSGPFDVRQVRLWKIRRFSVAEPQG